MAKIFINGLKANTGGGKCILENYLSLLHAQKQQNHHYYVLTPDKNKYSHYACDWISIIDTLSIAKKNLFFPLLYFYTIPKLLKKYDVDIIFNFGDVIIPTKTPQVYMFDWPYAAYPESQVWKMMDLKNFLMRKIKLALIKKYFKLPVTITTQTKTIEKRLRRYYNADNLKVVPSAIPLENLAVKESFDFGLHDQNFKFIYPTSFSPHKNLSILLQLAKLIKQKQYPFKIFLTIDETNNSAAKNFMKKTQELQLDSVINNVGRLNMEKVASLYRQTDALLMPTLLETYGLPYVEAMFHGKTVLTSDLDFAHDVCGDAAFYFDPFSAESILENIKKAYDNIELRNHKIEIGKDKIANLLTWGQVFEQYQSIIESNLEQ